VPPLDSEGRRLDELVLEIGRKPRRLRRQREREYVSGRPPRLDPMDQPRARDAPGTSSRFSASGSDATARKRAEENMLRYQARLRSLATRLATTEEQERLRVARQIHDTVIQSLSFVAHQTRREPARRSEKPAPRGTVAARHGPGAARRRHLQSRLLMSDLAPPMLYELGLSAALEDLAARLSRQHGVAIEVDDGVGLPPSLDQALLGMLFQSVRELVVNALKHASASLIRIEIRRADDTLTLSVRDNGAGFDPPASRIMGRGCWADSACSASGNAWKGWAGGCGSSPSPGGGPPSPSPSL